MYNRKAEEVEKEDFEEEDFLDELMREGTAKNPYFPEMVDAQTRKYELLEALAARRVELGLSRASVAKRLGISADALESLERGETNPKLALVMHLAHILGKTLELCPAPLSEETTTPASPR